MAGLSITHLLLMVFVLVLLFGTNKLKNIGHDLGSAIKGFKESVHESEADAPSQRAIPHNVDDR